MIAALSRMLRRGGIVVTATQVAAAVTERGRLVAARSLPRAIADGDGLREALRTVCADLRRLGVTRVNVALGASAARVQVLDDLPAGVAPGLLRAAVTHQPLRFLATSSPVRVEAQVVGPAALLVAAFDAETVESLRAVAQEARLVIRCIVPSAVALAVLRRTSQREPDGALLCSAAWDANRISGGQTLLAAREGTAGAPAGHSDPAVTAAAIAQMGRRDRQLALVAIVPTRESPRASPRQGIAAAAALVIGALALLGAGPLAAHLAFDRARQGLAEIEQRYPRAPQVAAQLRETDALADALAAFAGRRPSQLAVLERLARALPPSAFVVHVEADTATLTVVTLAADAGDVLARLDSAEGFTDARFVGPITRSVQGAAARERATVTVRLTAVDARP